MAREEERARRNRGGWEGTRCGERQRVPLLPKRGDRSGLLRQSGAKNSFFFVCFFGANIEPKKRSSEALIHRSRTRRGRRIKDRAMGAQTLVFDWLLIFAHGSSDEEEKEVACARVRAPRLSSPTGELILFGVVGWGHARSCVCFASQRAHVIKSLKASGLVPVMVKSTCNDTPEVHIWIRCPVSRLEEEAEKIAVKKPLQEGGGLAAFAAAKRHLFEGPIGLHAFFSSAERQQLIYSIIVSPNALNGAGLDLEKLKSQGYLIEAMPMHDNSHKQKLIDDWLNVSIFTIDKQPITEIKDYFGEELALYFAWAAHFVRCFVPLAFLGLITQIAQNIIKYQNSWSDSEGLGRQVSPTNSSPPSTPVLSHSTAPCILPCESCDGGGADQVTMSDTGAGVERAQLDHGAVRLHNAHVYRHIFVHMGAAAGALYPKPSVPAC
jgi:hypothetical protein